MTETTPPMSHAPTLTLFPEAPDAPARGASPVRPSGQAVVRVRMPNRAPIELRAVDLESLLPEGHRARVIWADVQRADLSGIYAGIKAVEGGRGRTPIAPAIRLALWLYATVQGVGSARAIARFTEEHDACRWIGGGVSVNDHTLSDFRAEPGEVRDELRTDAVAVLMAATAVKLKRVAPDGMRVQASAGTASFRRRGTLEQHREDARAHVEALKRQIDGDPAALSRRPQAARVRAAREREDRVSQALTRMPELERIKAQQGKPLETARASTTDAEATGMNMGDGGFRPADNAPFATDTETQVIIGVEVVAVSSDLAPLAPMVKQVTERYEQTPDEWLVDGGYPAHEQLDAVAEQTTVYAPVPKPKDPGPILISPSPRTAKPWPPGGNAWAPTTPR